MVGRKNGIDFSAHGDDAGNIERRPAFYQPQCCCLPNKAAVMIAAGTQEQRKSCRRRSKLKPGV
jgi:hypothetical protein